MFDKEKLFRRKNFLIKPEIQLKYLFLVILIILATLSISLWLVNLKIKSTPVLENLTYLEIVSVNRIIKKTILYVVVVSCVIIFVLGIFFLHRLTGPIYAIQRVIKSIALGDLSVKFKIRKTDELKEVANDIQNMIENLKGIVLEDKMKIEDIKLKLELILSDKDNKLSEFSYRQLREIRNLIDQLYKKFKI